MDHAITIRDVLNVFALLLIAGFAFVAFAVWYVNSGRG